jgi:hypothetical protein
MYFWGVVWVSEPHLVALFQQVLFSEAAPAKGRLLCLLLGECPPLEDMTNIQAKT